MLRRWQAILLATGVLASANASAFGNLDTYARPLLTLLAPGHGAIWRTGYLLALLLLAAAWVAMQRDQVAGGPFMAFAGSLPFTPRQRRRADLAVLLLADSPLLVVTACALGLTAGRGAPAAHAVLLADVALLALVAQQAVLERRAGAWPGVAAGAVLAGAAFGTRLDLAANLLVGAAAACALVMQPRPRAQRRVPSPHARRASPPAPGGRRGAALQMSLAVLLRERRGELLATCLTAAAIAAAAVGLVELFERDARSFPTMLLAEGAIALAFSGLFRGLHLAHRASMGYLGALPLPAAWWRPYDLAAVLAAALPFLAALTACAWAIGATPAHALAALASNAALLCALRTPQLISDRHAVVLTTIAAGCWTAGTFACLL
ncbi:hypothetical protein ASD28_08560 [Massilia sp. Root133]|uniref:hypothetical protein n=1 Tax=Massilia sp. Root133 TaxID=1736455 RepID=UPI0006F5A6D1|nr:hypothetical protein [Massilia sp. Root133]KQY01542.1 hypothetical protein ASD28_08560 [Massilia sp. Root133]